MNFPRTTTETTTANLMSPTVVKESAVAEAAEEPRSVEEAAGEAAGEALPAETGDRNRSSGTRCRTP